MIKYFLKCMETFWGRFVGWLGGLLRHPTVAKVIVSLMVNILSWLIRLAFLGLLSYVGFTAPILQ
jgi:hypothetical protein